MDEKKRRIIIGIVAAIIIAGLPVIFGQIEKNTAIEKLEQYLTDEYGLEIEKITAKKDSSKEYCATVCCNNLDTLSYEEMTRIVYHCDIDGISIQSMVCKGDTYKIFTQSIYKNDDLVYENHICEECSKRGSNFYKNPFSGKKEWYCDKHYKELRELLDSFS